MKPTYLKRVFLFRSILNKHSEHYTEVETNVMIAIYLMNQKGERCSCNTLFKYLSKVNRTPYRKTLLSVIRKFKEVGIINIYGRGAGTNIKIATIGQLYLFELENKLKR